MAIFPGGKSTRINSPRHLTLRHSRRIAAAHRHKSKLIAGIVDVAEDEVDPLPLGQQKLNSYWAPGLQAGPKHNISVTQSIDAPTNETLSLEAERVFLLTRCSSYGLASTMGASREASTRYLSRAEEVKVPRSRGTERSRAQSCSVARHILLLTERAAPIARRLGWTKQYLPQYQRRCREARIQYCCQQPIWYSQQRHTNNYVCASRIYGGCRGFGLAKS
ncbi:hypothetical protein F4678DRAFT_455072 [Xylaria arbuscula]|nr:hypothetical protein F4678DRAFT_455072 [Xylaria arbuscula]